MKKKYQIFISYRRQGAEELARTIHDNLEQHGYRVFYDVESMRSGKFNEKLFEYIDECEDVIVLLPEGGLDRCQDPDDWVYKEIAYAISRRKNIIPILMKGFAFPKDLPEGIRELPEYNGIEATMSLFPETMEKLRKNFLKSVSGKVLRKRRILAGSLILAAVLAVGAAVWLRLGKGAGKDDGVVNKGGYGPYDRKLFSLNSPADYVTFNSIVDNNDAVGDERYFVSASKYTGDASKNYWSDYTTVEDGQEYVVRVYVDNNADPKLGLTAQDTRAYVILPEQAGTELHVSGKIYAANAKPDTVWDAAGFYSADERKFILQYVSGSARYYTTSDQGESMTFDLQMDSAVQELHLFQQEGCALGNNDLDGKVSGGPGFSGYLTFHLIAWYEEPAGTH